MDDKSIRSIFHVASNAELHFKCSFSCSDCFSLNRTWAISEESLRSPSSRVENIRLKQYWWTTILVSVVCTLVWAPWFLTAARLYLEFCQDYIEVGRPVWFQFAPVTLYTSDFQSLCYINLIIIKVKPGGMLNYLRQIFEWSNQDHTASICMEHCRFNEF